MQAVIIHKPGKRIKTFTKELRYENIMATSMLWKSNGKLRDRDVLAANIVIIYFNSKAEPEVLKAVSEIRRCRKSVPIIVLDESVEHSFEMNVPELGVDLYVNKPVTPRKLAFLIKNLLCKRDVQNVNKWLRAFDIWLDMEHRSAKRNRQIIPLRNKEFALLEFFIINRGKILTRNSILEHVWDRNAQFSSNTVDVHINRLRRKIDDPFSGKLIHTVPCIGYIFDKKHA